MPEADQEGERYSAAHPKKTPGFIQKASQPHAWGMTNRLARVSHPATLVHVDEDLVAVIFG
jgi:hypothetical protein